MHAKNNGELQPTGRSKLLTVRTCTHAALGNTDPPQQQADTTTFRPREVVGPPMEVVARPTLTPRDQTSNYTENELPALQFSSPWLARRETKTPERRGCCCGLPAGYLRGMCAAVLTCKLWVVCCVRQS